MNCKSCNNPMVKVHGQSHFCCRSCNTFEFENDMRHSQIPIIPQGSITDFQCPRCNVALEVGLIQGGQVCFCSNCRGFVTPTESFGRLINELRGAYDGPEDRPVPIDPEELEFVENCPACLESMEAHPYYGPGNVVLDTCNRCKLAWLDHGELGKIVRAPGQRSNLNVTGNFESQVLRDAFMAQMTDGRFRIL